MGEFAQPNLNHLHFIVVMGAIINKNVTTISARLAPDSAGISQCLPISATSYLNYSRPDYLWCHYIAFDREDPFYNASAAIYDSGCLLKIFKIV